MRVRDVDEATETTLQNFYPAMAMSHFAEPVLQYSHAHYSNSFAILSLNSFAFKLFISEENDIIEL